MNERHPALDEMRKAIDALVSGTGSIRSRMIAAEPHFGAVFVVKMHTRAEEHMRLRIGAALVEGGDEDSSDVDDAHDEAEEKQAVVESIEALDEARLVEIAKDMVVMYELLAGVRTDDGYQF